MSISYIAVSGYGTRHLNKNLVNYNFKQNLARNNLQCLQIKDINAEVVYSNKEKKQLMKGFFLTSHFGVMSNVLDCHCCMFELWLRYHIQQGGLRFLTKKKNNSR